MEERCCFDCCSVRTGTQLISFMWLLFDCCNFVTSVYYLGLWVNDPDQDQEKYDDSRKVFEEYLEYPNIFLGVLIYQLISSVIDTILSGLLFLGAHTNDVKKCIPWLYYNAFLYVLKLLAVGILLIYLLFFDTITAIKTAVLLIIPLVIWAYLLDVVKRYITELQESGGRLNNAGQVYYAP